MKVLLDTHAFLWWITEDPKLSSKASEIIREGNNELYFSAASGWEIAIKAQLNRIRLPGPPGIFISEQLRINGIQSLPILMSHALHVYNLPEHHRDPFDRILVVQSQLEGLPILTVDPSFSLYEIEVIWE